MRTEKEIRAKLKEHMKIFDRKRKKTKKEKSNSALYLEIGLYLISTKALAWVLEGK